MIGTRELIVILGLAVVAILLFKGPQRLKEFIDVIKGSWRRNGEKDEVRETH